MREVWLVSTENRPKAEDILKKDDITSRQSIFLRAPSALDIKEDGFFIIMDGSEQALKRANELLKDIAKKYDKKDDVLIKFDEIEASTNEAFGFTLGG